MQGEQEGQPAAGGAEPCAGAQSAAALGAASGSRRFSPLTLTASPLPLSLQKLTQMARWAEALGRRFVAPNVPCDASWLGRSGTPHRGHAAPTPAHQQRLAHILGKEVGAPRRRGCVSLVLAAHTAADNAVPARKLCPLTGCACISAAPRRVRHHSRGAVRLRAQQSRRQGRACVAGQIRRHGGACGAAVPLCCRCGGCCRCRCTRYARPACALSTTRVRLRRFHCAHKHAGAELPRLPAAQAGRPRGVLLPLDPYHHARCAPHAHVALAQGSCGGWRGWGGVHRGMRLQPREVSKPRRQAS